jgi:hypothetical protein
MTHSADFLRAVHHNLCDMAGEMVRAEMRLARGGGREPETFVKWEDMTHMQRRILPRSRGLRKTLRALPGRTPKSSDGASPATSKQTGRASQRCDLSAGLLNQPDEVRIIVRLHIRMPSSGIPAVARARGYQSVAFAVVGPGDTRLSDRRRNSAPMPQTNRG